MIPELVSAEEFLSAPKTQEGSDKKEGHLVREVAVGSDLPKLQEALRVSKGSETSYTQQYANIYFLRLTLLRPRVEEAARRKWKDYQPNGPRTKLSMSRVLDIQTDQTTWIVGTIFADMSLKPNVLHDLQSEMNLSKPHTQPFYYHEGDDVYIEDESGRVKLWGKLPQSDMVTGK